MLVPLLQDLFPRLIVGIVALVTLIGVLHFYDTTPTVWRTIEEHGFLLYMAGWIVVFLIGASLFRKKKWYELKAAFPHEFSGELLDGRFAFGFIDLEEEQTTLVRTIAVPEGILVAKPRKKMKPRHLFLIPWERIERVTLPEPDWLSASESEGSSLMSRLLTADLQISRGRYPTFKVKLPWSYFFNRHVPSNIDLVQDWQWPHAMPQE